MISPEREGGHHGITKTMVIGAVLLALVLGVPAIMFMQQSQMAHEFSATGLGQCNPETVATLITESVQKSGLADLATKEQLQQLHAAFLGGVRRASNDSTADTSTPAASPGGCVDTPNWKDKAGNGCNIMVAHGHCGGGMLTPWNGGFDRAAMASWGNPPPYDACCECGKGKPPPVPTPAPVPGPPLPCPPPPPDTKGFKALSPYALDDFQESGITKEHILAPNYMNMYARFAIKEGKLYTCGKVNTNEYPKIVKALKTLPPEIMNSGNAMFSYCLEDFSYTPKSAPKGIYLAKGSHPNNWDLASPDYDFMISASFKPWAERWAELDKAADATPWASKKDVAFFRGKFTGRDWPTDIAGRIPLTPDEPKNNPRWAVFSKKDGTKTPKKGVMYDVGGSPGPESEFGSAKFNALGIQSKTGITMPEHCQYKYLLNPCGRGPQGIRLKELMACGSLTWMHDWPHRESYYHLIEPWKHVILWASTSDGLGGSNLDATLDWAALHPIAAEQIAKNGRKLIKERVGPDHYANWWKEFISEFKRLSEGKIDWNDPSIMASCKPL